MKVFADTNVLIYFVDDTDLEKQEAARHILSSHWPQLVISTQVLVEFHAACSIKKGMDARAIGASVRDFAQLHVLPTDARSVVDAVDIAERTGLSTYDAMIAEAAQRGGCELLLTEDAKLLGADLTVNVENPFV